MILRLSKCALLFAAALYFTLVVFNNVTDYNSNFQFVRHVLMMDSTFPGNHGMGRALAQPRIHTIFYLGIICWESCTTLLFWWGAIRLTLATNRSPAAFQRAKSIAIAALTMGCLLWFTAFISVGGEWFLMWQSRTWNGEEAAFRLFAILGIILLYVSSSESELHA